MAGGQVVKRVTESSCQLPVAVPATSVGSHVSARRTPTPTAAAADSAEHRRLIGTLSSPFIRQDIFYAGSVTSLREYKTSNDMAAYVQVTPPCFTALGSSYSLVVHSCPTLAKSEAIEYLQSWPHRN